jgi:hypothetical protein
MERRPLGFDWEPNLFRLSIFTFGSQKVPTDLWRHLAEQEPELIENRAREASVRESGPFGKGVLDVVSVPGRVDIIWAKPALQAGDMKIAVTLGKLEPALGDFEKLVSKLLDDWGVPTVRIAFGAALRSETDSARDAYERLAESLLSVAVDPRGMRDFLYRVNWRVPCLGRSIGYFNRLTTWSELSLMLELTPVGAPPSTAASWERHFASLELDINTPAENPEPLASQDLEPIFQQLVDLARENAEFGERR